MNVKVFLSLLLVWASTQVFAQDDITVDEIVNEYISVTNLEQEVDMTAMRMTFKMSMQGLELPGTITKARPNKQHVRSEFQGRAFIQAFDGETGWTVNPMTGGTPTIMTQEEAKQMKSEPFESDLLGYAEKGHTLELLGTKEIDGVPTYEVLMTKEDGDEVYLYFDQETSVIIMRKSEVKDGPQAGAFIETYLSEYNYMDEEDESSLVMPFSIESRVNGQTATVITLTGIEVDPELAEDLFDFPEEEEATANE